jgi:hypothetical protein
MNWLVQRGRNIQRRRFLHSHHNRIRSVELTLGVRQRCNTIVVCPSIALSHRSRNCAEQTKENECTDLHSLEPLNAILFAMRSYRLFKVAGGWSPNRKLLLGTTLAGGLIITFGQGSGVLNCGCLLPHHFAALHDEAHVLYGGDVVERVAGDGDYVGEVAGFELADLVVPA